MKLRNVSLYLSIFSLLLSVYMVFGLTKPCKHQALSFVNSSHRSIIVSAQKPICFPWWKNHHDEPHDHPESDRSSLFEVAAWRKKKKYGQI